MNVMKWIKSLFSIDIKKRLKKINRELDHLETLRIGKNSPQKLREIQNEIIALKMEKFVIGRNKHQSKHYRFLQVPKGSKPLRKADLIKMGLTDKKVLV